jgi:hypothetical protein
MVPAGKSESISQVASHPVHGVRPMPNICVFPSIGYIAHMVYNKENLQKYHTVAPKKNTRINSKGFTSLDGDMMIQWRRSFEVHESFAKTIGRHI